MNNIEKKDLIKYEDSLKSVSEIMSGIDTSGLYDTIANYDEIINTTLKNISLETKYFEKFLSLNTKIWESYNIQYKTLFNNRINSIQPVLDQIINYDISNKLNYKSLFRGLEKYNQSSRLNVLEIFDNFKYDNCNYVLFGKNGSGKTTLLNKLKKEFITDNSIVVPATRQIGFDNNYMFQLNQITLDNALRTLEHDKTMPLLSLCVRDRELDNRRDNLPEENIITNKVIDIFNRIGLDRKIRITSQGIPELFCEGQKQYPISDGSDGEKTALYFIMVILLAPENSFLFIDEPENHLNGAIMRKLFDILEVERQDIKFIYATHSIPFIETRKKVKLVYLEKNNKKDTWKFKEINDFDEMPLELILDVEGTNDDVIFCEGEANKSLDIKLLTLLFPDKQIISSEGCEKVLLQTAIFNKNKRILRKKAFGIVDYDFRTDEDIRHLNEKNIYPLNVNEIENAYILESCIETVLNQLGSTKTFEDVKEEVINKIKNKIKDIKKDYATKTFRKLHTVNRFDNVDDINAELNKINNKNNEMFLESYTNFVKELEEGINNKNYTLLMKNVPGKMIINETAKAIGLVDVDMYTNMVLNNIMKDSNLRDKVKNTIINII